MKENFKSKEYFKPCVRFKRREHPFDIGMSFSWWPGHYDRHFLNNLYERKGSEFSAFYRYHLDPFLKVNEGAQEVEFYKHLRDITNDGIAALIKEKLFPAGNDGLTKIHPENAEIAAEMEKVMIIRFLSSFPPYAAGSCFKNKILAQF